ncbi:efflux RND transporter periplasmic adaptor subunit [Brevibacillus dissolubilis]|uniref:efflux RND transporter periplasmic adaptor subunit n=1 Tax=Brevibacillus dissolubilis TaxID=1844116 RepID=UPI002100158E|nr:efflux RND transporter periplasmic adaptor subunit [Brevibacillus dissolubilis]
MKWSKSMMILLLSTAVVAGCTQAEPAATPAATTQETKIKTVKVISVTKQQISEPLEQVADIVSSTQLDLIAKVGGDVLQVFKKRGDTVRKGEVIYRLDPTDMQIQRDKGVLGVRSAQAQLSKGREDLTNGKRDLKNSIERAERNLREVERTHNNIKYEYELGAIPKNTFDQSLNQLNNARFEVETLKKEYQSLETTTSLDSLEVQLQMSNLNIKEAERALSNMEVKSPVDGILTDLTIKEGMRIQADASAGQVQQLDPVKIQAELTETAANLVRGKKELSFYVSGSGQVQKGKVTYLADVMNSTTKTFPLELEVPNKDRKLKPGSKAQILLTEEKDEVVVAIPTLSIVREGGITYVFVLVGDHVEKRKVELGRLNETNQEVLLGIKEGEQLVIYGQNQLKDQEKVQLQQEAKK